MSQEDRFQVGLIQLSCSPDPEANLEKAVQRVREAARNGAQIICLPELFRTQYFCQREDPALFDLAETIPGPTTEAMSRVAAESKSVVVVSIFEKRTRGLYHNTAVLIGTDGAIKGIYRKMHIPDDPLYYEKYYFTPGDRFQGIRYRSGSHRNLGVLGSVVSGRRTAHGFTGRAGSVLSDGYRLASGGERAIWK